MELNLSNRLEWGNEGFKRGTEEKAVRCAERNDMLFWLDAFSIVAIDMLSDVVVLGC